jgi:hypothetical protein
MGETSSIRNEVLEYCVGNGLDLGCGEDKITPSTIGFDVPPIYPSRETVEMRGGCQKIVYV